MTWRRWGLRAPVRASRGLSPDGSARGNLDHMDTEQIAQQVAEQVRELVAEAETQSAALLAEAEVRAREIIASAEAEAHQVRLEAQEEARQLRSEADVSTQGRVDELRRGLDELQSKLRHDPSGEVTPPVTVPEPQPGPSPIPEPPATPEPEPGPVPEPEPPLIPEPTPPPDEGTPPEIDPVPGASELVGNGSASRRDDPAGARLVAMNMALNDSTPETIVAAIEQDFDLANPRSVVDDVLTRTGVKRP